MSPSDDSRAPPTRQVRNGGCAAKGVCLNVDSDGVDLSFVQLPFFGFPDQGLQTAIRDRAKCDRGTYTVEKQPQPLGRSP